MALNDLHKFHQLEQELGSSYAAVNLIASEARKLATQYDNKILHSEAIDWYLTGNKPKILNDKYKLYTSSNYVRSYVDEVLSYVDDIGVCESVRHSISASRSSNHLIYVYKDVSDDFRQARVRVLTRIIWYDLNLDRRSNYE